MKNLVKQFILLLVFCLISATTAQEYIIVGWNDLGMHMANKDFKTIAVHPPSNNIRAQVIKVGTKSELPSVLTDGFYVTYEIPGNTYSVGKTNFWEYEDHLFGVTLSDNIGLYGSGLAGNMTIRDNYFAVDGIPLTPYQNSDLNNEDPYQLARLNLYDTNDNLLASAQPVVPVSNEISCVNTGCHRNEQDIIEGHEEGVNTNNTPILCISCHQSNLFGTTGSPDLESFSEVIHEKHKGKAEDCYKCHPGSNTRFYRGIMSSKGITCRECHGQMMNIAESIKQGRRPWLDEPSCSTGGCHDATHSENANKLFKDSKGHGGLYCSVCHGSPHAIYPSSLERDNFQMIALQGKEGTLTNCSVCHGTALPPGPGPHGILPPLPEFASSLHATRQGHATWYNKENGGFENFTDIPLNSLQCQNCHADTKADGTTIDDQSYQPDCYDCHDIDQWIPVEQNTCLGCHKRQQLEIELANDPLSTYSFSDVHRDAGMVCTDCHTEVEMHGDGLAYSSLLQAGAITTSCNNEGCHPEAQMSQSTSHSIHQENVDCSACHVKTVISCYGCHFETQVETGEERYFGQTPLNDFIMLVNSEKHGKVASATFQVLTYEDTVFYAIAPYYGHTVSAEGRDCLECHINESVRSYHENGQISVTSWDPVNNNLSNTKSVIPVSPDWRSVLQMDFIKYDGVATDPIEIPFDSTKWKYLKSTADGMQMVFASPLTGTQMNELNFNFTAIEDLSDEVPGQYKLIQNFPNPFNPLTRIRFDLPRSEIVNIAVYNTAGQKVIVLINKRMSAGSHEVELDGQKLSSGVYLYKMQAGEFQVVRKMILLK